jgi:hypothetical protein
MKNLFKSGLLVFLLVNAINAFADRAVVVSKQENLPQGDNRLKTRLFLNTNPTDNNNRANAYVDLYNVNQTMAMQEFCEMIQVGDIIEYIPNPRDPKDGRYSIIHMIDLIELNGENIYRIFLEVLENRAIGNAFSNARRAYEASKNDN